MQAESEQGVLSSVGAWLGNPLGSPTTLLERKSWPPGLTWLAYAALDAEERAERRSDTWRQLQQALRHYDESEAAGGAHVSVDTALKVRRHV